MRRQFSVLACAAFVLQAALAQNKAEACLARDPVAGQGAICPIASTCKCQAAAKGLHSQVFAADAQAAATSNVQIVNFDYSPDPITIQQGTTVKWTNADSTTHTVTSDTSGVFDSKFLNRSQSFSFTFNTAGTFAYHCDIHPFMTGSVKVTAVPEPATAGVLGLAALMLGFRRARRGRDEQPAR